MADGSIVLKGKWTARLYRGETLVQEVSGPNVVCTNGKEILASFMGSAAAGTATYTCRYAAVGTDSTGEAAANTALGTELARVSGSVSYVSNAIVRVVATFASGTGTGAIVEYGLFNSSTGGTMLSRDTESVINKGANDILVTQMDLTIS